MGKQFGGEGRGGEGGEKEVVADKSQCTNCNLHHVPCCTATRLLVAVVVVVVVVIPFLSRYSCGWLVGGAQKSTNYWVQIKMASHLIWRTVDVAGQPTKEHMLNLLCDMVKSIDRRG